MSNDTHLWDDSALLSAFNDAVYKYKKMHGREQQPEKISKNSLEGSDQKEGEEILNNSTEESYTSMKAEEFANDKKRPYHSKDGEKILSGGRSQTVLTLVDTRISYWGLPTLNLKQIGSLIPNLSLTDGGEVNDLQPFQENPHTESHAPELNTDSSADPQMPEILEGYTNTEAVDQYNQLLNQYYELEEQRQKVLLQLQQVGYWNYPYSGEGSGNLQCGTFSTEEHQNSNNQTAQLAAPAACCPYACQGLAIPCSVMPACPLGEAGPSKGCIDASLFACTMSAGKTSFHGDDTLVKTAMGAAKKALSSTKLNTSSAHEGASEERKMADMNSTETDLSDVLNAWYSAGFHTGKYLSEQSIAKRRHD